MSFGRVETDLFVILLEGSHVFAGLREFTLLHALSDIPVDKGALGVHQVKLVVQTTPSLGNSSGVGEHAHGSLNFSEVATRNNGGRLVVDAHFETGGTPINKLDGSLW